MIPSINILTDEITEQVYPNRTYNISFNVNKNDYNAVIGTAVIGSMVLGKNKTDAPNRITGYVDGLDALKQAVYLILSTERYEYPIYSWDYGVELLDLIGKPMPYVMSEIPRRITEALTQDNRVEDVVDFEFKTTGKKIHVKFTVVSNIGDIPTELEVDV